MTDRIDRVSETVKREIAIILKEAVFDAALSEVTVTGVKVARDLKTAKVFCVVSDITPGKEEIMRKLKKAAGFIRGELAKRVSMKFIPSLNFFEDASEESVESIEKIFGMIAEERGLAGEGSEKSSPDGDAAMEKVLEALRNGENFIITAHVNPEGDSIGSQLAMEYLLKKMGKKTVMVDDDEVPDNLKFLKGIGCISRSVPADMRPDTIIFLDCPVRDRSGKVCEGVAGTPTVVNIDHHVSNVFFGDVNWVEPEASSVGEMMFRLIKKAGFEIDKETAEAVYAAILTDTGMFNYDNTSAATHETAAELIRLGVAPKFIYNMIYEKKSSAEMRLLGKVLETLTLEEDGRIAYVTMTREMCEAERSSRPMSTEEFINYPRAVRGVEVAVFFKETHAPEGPVKVSFRSLGRIDVNAIASVFGGGGHPQASGCTLNRGLEMARAEVLAEVRKALNAAG